MGKGRMEAKPEGRRNLGLQYDYLWARNSWWEYWVLWSLQWPNDDMASKGHVITVSLLLGDDILVREERVLQLKEETLASKQRGRGNSKLVLGLRQIVEVHASTHMIASGWWNSADGIMDAMSSPISEGRNGIKEKGEEETTTWWIKLKLVLDLWQNVEMPPYIWDNYLTGGWWNPGEWAMGANERRTKWHQSKMEERMSGYFVV